MNCLRLSIGNSCVSRPLVRLAHCCRAYSRPSAGTRRRLGGTRDPGPPGHRRGGESLLAGLVGLLAVYWQLLPALVDDTVGETLRALNGAVARAEAVLAPLRAGPVLRRIVLEPYEAPLAMFLILMTAASAVVGAALTRLLGERRAQP